MSKRKLIFIPLVVVTLFGFISLQDSFMPKSETLGQDKQSVLKNLLFISLQQAHFKDVVFDDKMSEEAYNMYLKNIDPNKRFLLKEDIDMLSAYKNQIDDEMMGADNPLYEMSVKLLDQRRAEAKQYCEEILSKSFDFDKKEDVELDADKVQFASSKEELKERWRKYLKYSALVRMHNKMEAEDKKEKEAKEKKEEFARMNPEELEADVRSKVKSNYDDVFDALDKMDEEDRITTYLNSIISVYGPHTEYFPPESKEKFDAEMSGRFEGIGARLQQTGGEIKVVQIIPGSASWRQKELKEGDIILKVAQEEAEPVSVEDMSLKNAVKLIKGPKGTEVRLTVKKPDGRLTVIPIIRDEVILEESYAKSAVIVDKETGKKWGVIELPSFYADFQHRNGRFSGDDVIEELKKLKQEQVEGVMLDLRNNGGGSLSDAVKMAGAFIDKGPVVQVKSKTNRAQALPDTESGVEYDGPLVIMVNRFSASASEILAAAMQDYGRAVIVGSKTFGKGTVQRFIDLDRLSRMDEYKPFGALKLTVQKFYRVSGGATQVKGVEPDVHLPDMYAYLDVGEEDLPYVMPWDKVEKADFKNWDHKPNMKALAKRSSDRIAKNDVFNLVEENAKRLKSNNDKTLQSLNLKAFAQEQKKLDEESKKFNDLEKEHNEFDIKVMADHYPTSKPDSVIQETANRWTQQLKKDVYIKEASQVLNDMVSTN
ncbi:carboxy terminal-processing peptidase [Limibacter armeniacum]|uniref:carboxy terminal-processing peptidase n=1 Tax=Limibacter armeniacum TaxID=466084 RepID=UPI002FE607C0